MTIAISTAVASKSDASTPTAWSISQLRAIWAKTATRISTITRAAAVAGCAGPPGRSRSPRASGVPGFAGRRRAAPRRRGDERQPPRQAERPDERERGQSREHGLDREDRHLCGDQRRHARALGRSGAAQRADARRRAELAVELAPEIAHARGPEQAAASDRAAGGRRRTRARPRCGRRARRAGAPWPPAVRRPAPPAAPWRTPPGDRRSRTPARPSREWHRQRWSPRSGAAFATRPDS